MLKKIATGERKNLLNEDFFTNLILNHTNLITCFHFDTLISPCLFEDIPKVHIIHGWEAVIEDLASVMPNHRILNQFWN